MVVTAAVYLRVSSSRQTVDNQAPDVDRLVGGRGFQVVETYAEAESAYRRRRAERPAFDRLMAAAKGGHFKVVVVWALDRFGRDMVGNLLDWRELARVGVSVISVREPWLEQSGPMSELLIALVSWMAEQESSRRSERVRAGLARVRATGTRSGRAIGRPRADVDRGEVAELAARGFGQRQIASKLRASRRTVQRILQAQNVALLGLRQSAESSGQNPTHLGGAEPMGSAPEEA